MALQIAALQVETTNQQQEADKATRDAARNAKLAEMKAEEDALRDQADKMMQGAIIGGALRVGAGASKFCAASNSTTASSGDQTAAGTGAQSDKNWLGIADGFEAATFVSDKVTDSGCKDLEGDVAQHKRLAEQEQATIDDQSDRIRRREDQFGQKLAVLEDTMKSAHDTERVIIRG